MQILVMGAGAIGILMADRLERAGHAVVMVGRPAVADAASQHGVLVSDEQGERRLRAPVRTAIDPSAPTPDLILLTVKAFDTGTAANELRLLTDRGAPILVIQNGVGGEVAGLAALPEARWYGAVTTIVAEWLGPAQVRQSRRKAAVAVAPLANVKGIDLVARAFHGAGFDEVRAFASYDAMKWSKLLLNMLGNAAPAIVDIPVSQALRDPVMFAIEQAAYREALAVMRAAHIQPMALPGYPVPLLASAMRWLPATLARPLLTQAVAGGRGGKMPSLHMDLTRRRERSEVEFLNGAIARQGTATGTPTPVNRALTETLSAIVRGDELWEQFRGRPERLYRRCGLTHSEDTR